MKSISADVSVWTWARHRMGIAVAVDAASNQGMVTIGGGLAGSCRTFADLPLESSRLWL